MKDLRPKEPFSVFFYSLILGLFLSSKLALAQPWYIPLNAEISSLSLANLEKQDLTLWLAGPVGHPLTTKEVAIEVKAKTTLIVSLPNEFKSLPWIQIKNYNQVKVSVTAHSLLGKTVIFPGRSNHVNFLPVTESQTGHLLVSNLSPMDQEGHIHLLSPSGKGTSQKIQMKPFETLKIPFSAEKGDRFGIIGEYALTARWQSPLLVSSAFPSSSQNVSVQPIGTYFLVSNSSQSSSFIIRLEDAQLVHHARQQIQDPTAFLPRILVARIDFGHHNYNRDLNNPWKSPWSWHVAQVFRFADFGSQTCDGSPQFIEDFMVPWIESGTSICLWNYRVIKELSTQELQ